MSDPLDALIDQHLSGGADPLDALIDEHLGPQTLKLGQAQDIGPGATFGAHVARHLAFGLGDKLMAGLQAVGDKLHDKTGKVTLGDAYRRDLAFNDKTLDRSDEANPGARWAGNVAGFAGSMAVPAGVLRAGTALGLRAAPVAYLGALPPRAPLSILAAQGAKTGAALGALGGYGGSRSDGWGGTALDTGLGTLGGAALGYGAPYAGAAVGKGASYLGGKAVDLASWLKVHSLHPTPTVAEKMAELPGGEEGVGRELLERGIGALTAKGTAAQVKAETKAAGAAIDAVAKAHDAAGGAAVDLTPAFDSAMVHAAELRGRPGTEAAGEKMGAMLEKYRNLYAGRPVTAAEALSVKRELGKLAYGASKQFEKSGDTIAGDFGAGMSKAERAVDDTLDQTLGPAFGEANTAFRRLLGADRAAKRLAGRTQGNHLLQLLPLVAGAGGAAAHGAEGGLAAAAATHLFGKYGSQAGARSLYTMGRGLEMLGGANLSSAIPGAASAATQQVNPVVEALLSALNRRPTQTAPTLAMDDR